MRAPWTFVDAPAPVVATAIHAGHDLRPEIISRIALDDASRLREEDPFTDRLAAVGGSTVVVHRSRFEVDLNRPREDAVYQVPDDAWGYELWRERPPLDELERSRGLYDEFYGELMRRLVVLAARGPFLVLDVHSYNHRREGLEAAQAPPADNPEVNIGTGSLDRARWGRVADRCIDELSRRSVHGRRLDVRENVRFRGGELSRWVHRRFGEHGCALAIEFKKVFMDEWTGALDERHLEGLRDALTSVVPALIEELRVRGSEVIAVELSETDLAVDRALADIATSFRFLYDVTPVDLVAGREAFWDSGSARAFEYRALPDDPDVTMARLREVPVGDVEDPTVAHLLQAKHRELDLLLQMLSCRGSGEFLALSIEQFGAVTPSLLQEAQAILETVPAPPREAGPWLDAHAFLQRAQQELDQYRAFAPDIESHVELREGSSGVMVSNGDLLVAPTARVAAARVDALLQHEIGTHVVTFVNGSHQPLRTIASGLAGHEETQEGLAVLAEYLVGGLTAARLRQLAARVVAVHEMIDGVGFPEVHHGLVAAGVEAEPAFTITMRVFRGGGLTKDAVYLRGLQDLVAHLVAGHPLDTLWLGKMPLTAIPLVEDLHRRGVLTDALLTPRFLDNPGAHERLGRLWQVESLSALVGGSP